MRVFSRNTLACLGLMLGIIAGCHSASHDSTSAADMAKIDPQLAAAAGDLARGVPAVARIDTQGRLQVYVYTTDTGAATLADIAGAGLTGAEASPEMSAIQGWIAPKDLATLVGLACVKRIALPRYASPR